MDISDNRNIKNEINQSITFKLCIGQYAVLRMKIMILSLLIFTPLPSPKSPPNLHVKVLFFLCVMITKSFQIENIYSYVGTE